MTSILSELDDFAELEDLFDEAQAAKPPRTRKRANTALRGALSPSAKTVVDLYRFCPENYVRKGGVAIVHTATQSLVGVFARWEHRSIPNCSRLVRESGPLAVDEVREVADDWWLGADRRPEPRKPVYETRTTRIKLHLPEIDAWAPVVEVAVRLEAGWIKRIDLAKDTLLASAAGDHLINLPAGTNIMPAMPHQDKVQLRQELGL